MSDTDDNTDNAPEPEAPIDDAEPQPQQTEQADAPQKKSSGNGVAWLAVLLAAIALLLVGYYGYEDWRQAGASSELDNLASIEALSRQLGSTQEQLANVEGRFGQIQHPDFKADIDAVQRSVEEQIRLLNSLPSRMAAIENSVASLAGISEGARETFLLAEAEYYMQIANAQLQLANNPELASLALKMADERVTQLSNPSLTAVRRAVSDELAALEVMEKPDLEGATLTLASLARVVDSLPLASEQSGDSAAVEGTSEDDGNMARAWGSVKDAMSGLVKVTPPEQARLALLSPDAEYFLRSNLALQLQAARLALLRGEQAIFQQTLDDTEALLQAWFDTDSSQVGSALLTIGEIKATVFTTATPDISESLRLLRQFRTLSESSE
ncbi:MAG: uroporphyrinogen-III C-methyltransferase [Gammaproteobacteria bacterium]|nr:uroporphyrinogen-III C-methyltransferase [Gammaproteobacteria bacterium]